MYVRRTPGAPGYLTARPHSVAPATDPTRVARACPSAGPGSPQPVLVPPGRTPPDGGRPPAHARQAAPCGPPAGYGRRAVRPAAYGQTRTGPAVRPAERRRTPTPRTSQHYSQPATSRHVRARQRSQPRPGRHLPHHQHGPGPGAGPGSHRPAPRQKQQQSARHRTSKVQVPGARPRVRCRAPGTRGGRQRALKYFASGWWMTIASVDCSGWSWNSSDSFTPIRSGSRSSAIFARSSRSGQAP